ncbi:MAG: hypothetical protein HC860_19360 [Alkalinema sp. RU_4_3]|nr:hypothetical protein [Alkalinema sp. RU_4_3]
MYYDRSHTFHDRLKPMVKKADIGSKRLISLAPDAWAKCALCPHHAKRRHPRDAATNVKRDKHASNHNPSPAYCPGLNW